MDFKVEQHIDTKYWLSNYIIIENQDTIYYNQNSNWENWFSKEELKKLKVRKSLTQKYYHLRMTK